MSVELPGPIQNSLEKVTTLKDRVFGVDATGIRIREQLKELRIQQLKEQVDEISRRSLDDPNFDREEHLFSQAVTTYFQYRQGERVGRTLALFGKPLIGQMEAIDYTQEPPRYLPG